MWYDNYLSDSTEDFIKNRFMQKAWLKPYIDMSTKLTYSKTLFR